MAKKQALMSEAALQAHVVKLLQAYARHDVCWWHCPNGELRNHSVGAKLKLAGVRAGAADLMLVVDGQFHALELKTEIGTLSGKQISFAEDVERAGGFAHSAFGLDQAIGTLKGINAFRSGITFSIPKLTANAFVGRAARSPAVPVSVIKSQGRPGNNSISSKSSPSGFTAPKGTMPA